MKDLVKEAKKYLLPDITKTGFDEIDISYLPKDEESEK